MADKAKVAQRKLAKPPKVPKKKYKSDSAEEDDDIPSAHSQPEDELVTDCKTLFSDGNPKKGSRGRERNNAAEMSDQETYKTPPGVETTQKGTIGCKRFTVIGRRSGLTMRTSEGNTRSCLHSLLRGMIALQKAALGRMMKK